MEKKKEFAEAEEVKMKAKNEVYEAPDFYEHNPLKSVSATTYYYYSF